MADFGQARSGSGRDRSPAAARVRRSAEGPSLDTRVKVGHGNGRGKPADAEVAGQGQWVAQVRWPPARSGSSAQNEDLRSEVPHQAVQVNEIAHPVAGL